MLRQVFLGGMAITLIVTAALGVFVGSVALSYFIFMGDDPWEGRFKFSTGCYFIFAFFLTGLGWSALAVIVAAVAGV